MKRYFEFAIVILLVANCIFLFLRWNDQRTSASHPDNTNDNLTYEKEIAATFSSLHGRPLAIDILVRKSHCGVCIDQALPYWLSLFGKVPTKIWYSSPSPSLREGERFAQQLGIPESLVVRNKPSSSADSLLWSGTAPTVVVRDAQSGIRYLVHIGSSDNRNRTTAFYKTLINVTDRWDSHQ